VRNRRDPTRSASRARGRVAYVRRRSRGSATLSGHARGKGLHTCGAGRAGAQPYQVTREGKGYIRAASVARERNPTGSRARERVASMRRRSRGSATLPGHARGEALPTCAAGRAGAGSLSVTSGRRRWPRAVRAGMEHSAEHRSERHWLEPDGW